MTRNTITAVFPLLLILLSIASSTWGFTAPPQQQHHHSVVTPSSLHASDSSGGDPSDIIARKLIVCGDVDGGYYRSCVKNEVCLIVCKCIIHFRYIDRAVDSFFDNNSDKTASLLYIYI
jgi:hypothetical protein